MADGLGAIKTPHNAQAYLHPLGVDTGEEGAPKSLPTRLSQGTTLLCNDYILPNLKKQAWVVMRTLVRHPAELYLSEVGLGKKGACTWTRNLCEARAAHLDHFLPSLHHMTQRNTQQRPTALFDTSPLQGTPSSTSLHSPHLGYARYLSKERKSHRTSRCGISWALWAGSGLWGFLPYRRLASMTLSRSLGCSGPPFPQQSQQDGKLDDC